MHGQRLRLGLPGRRFFPQHNHIIQHVRYRSGGKSGQRKKLARLLQKTSSVKYDRNQVKVEKFQEPKATNFVQTDIELRSLIEKANERIHARFTEPNIYWKNSLNLKATSSALLRKELEEKFGTRNDAFRPIDVVSSPLNVGDIVELGNSLETSELCCVVELPASISDPRYTFVNAYGDIKFASKNKISIRFPKMYPKEWFKDSVLDERTFRLKERGIKQIGKPKFLTEDSMTSNSATSFFEQALINNGHDLNQLDTFVMPSMMSQLLAKDLTTIIAGAWEELPIMNSKLELVHNLLQNSESPVVTNVFQLFAALNSIDITKAEKNILQLKSYQHLIDYYAYLSKRICKEISVENSFDCTSLGKPIFGNLDMFKEIELTAFFAMILALRKSDKLFDGINNPDIATHFPFSVTIMPLSGAVEVDLTIDNLKENPRLFSSLINYMVNRMKLVKEGDLTGLENLAKPEQYDKVIRLMKLYCSSSSQFDLTTESFLIKIFRNIPEFSDMAITSSLVYDTLFKLKERGGIQNPTDWSVDLLKPYTGTSEKSNMEQDFYNILSENQISVDKSFDLVSELRQDFSSDIVYCIDDADAHEVDDGISISVLPNGLYNIKTYVADVASYLRPEDTISKVAFERSTTVYFRDTESAPIEMLPSSVVKSVELRPGDKVRAMCFSFLYDSESKSFVENSLEINPVYVQRLINLTYGDVDLILAGDNSVLNTISLKFGIPAHVLGKDLNLLYEATSNMEQKRVNNTNYNFEFTEQLERVSRFGNDEDMELELTFSQISDSKSRTLVSETMIHTNALVARYLSGNRVPTIYRILKEMPVTDNVKRQLADLDRTNISDTQKAMNFMTGTSFSLFPMSHDYIGLGPYCTVTSPLRRFQDLFCHWQLQSFLKLRKSGEESGQILSYNDGFMFSEENTAYVLAHISSRYNKLKQVLRKGGNFFIYKKLQSLPESATFRVMVRSRPTSNGEVEGTMLDYGGVRCLLKSTVIFSNQKIIQDLEDQTTQNLNIFSTTKIGDVIENCKIEDIDLLTGNVIMTSTNF